MEKMRVALWTPLPPLKTGIADYVGELLPCLTRHWNMEIFIDEGYMPDFSITEKYAVYPYTMYVERVRQAPFDINLYQIGNNNYHWYIYEQALREPGVVVLHDASIAYMLYDALAGREGVLDAFLDELYYAEGDESVQEFMRYYSAGDHNGVMEFFSRHPMLRRLAERSYGFVTHLSYNADILRQRYPNISFVRSMYLVSSDPYERLPNADVTLCRKRLGWQDDQITFASFGFLQPNKQNDVTIKAFARIAHKEKKARLVFVGKVNTSGGYDQYLYSLAEKLQIKERVEFTGYLPQEKMLCYLLASDVVINLRYPSFGEMSATLSRAIAAGKPVIITDLPEWKFLPAEFCWRVPPHDLDGNDLAEQMLQLMREPLQRQRMGQAARNFYLKNGQLAHGAAQLHHFVADVKQNIIPQSDLYPLETRPVPSLGERLYRQLYTHYENWLRIVQPGAWEKKILQYRQIPLIGFSLHAGYKVFRLVRSYRARRRAAIALQVVMAETLLKSLQMHNETLRWQSFPLSRIVENPLQNLGDLPASLPDEIANLWLQSPTDETKPAGNGASSYKWDVFYKDLERVFRGSERVIYARQSHVWSYLKKYLVTANEPIVDLGCGRGEFLRLMRNENIPALGVDISGMWTEELAREGLDVVQQDALGYLRSCAPASLRGAVAFHVAEHVSFDYLTELLLRLHNTLIPGGFIYFETPNPLSHKTLAHFHTDPSHRAPIPPYFLAFLMHYAGFEVPEMLFLEPVPVFGNWEQAQWMQAYQDYGVIGRKPLT